MTRPTSSPSESIAVLNVSTMDAQYQTKRPPVRPAGASFNPWEGAYALSKPRSRRPRQMLTQWCLLISIRQTLMSARSGLEQAFSVAMAPENSIDGLKYVQVILDIGQSDA